MEGTDQKSRDINTIESIAERNELELDEIESQETQTDDGDPCFVYRAYSTKAETEEDSVGIQVSKVPTSPMGDQTFRQQVRRKLSKLSQHVNGDADQNAAELETTADEQSDAQIPQQPQQSQSVDSTGAVGEQLDAELAQMKEQIDDIESRLSALEEKADALDGLQQLLDASESD
jgi:hypothetical protein